MKIQGLSPGRLGPPISVPGAQGLDRYGGPFHLGAPTSQQLLPCCSLSPGLTPLDQQASPDFRVHARPRGSQSCCREKIHLGSGSSHSSVVAH